MSWAVGWDAKNQRDVGYGVPAICDHPDCDEKIDRGLSYVCGSEMYGGEHGCGLHFCSEHTSAQYEMGGDHLLLGGAQVCQRCAGHESAFEKKADTQEWVQWKLTHTSWQAWRSENPGLVRNLEAEANEH